MAVRYSCGADLWVFREINPKLRGNIEMSCLFLMNRLNLITIKS